MSRKNLETAASIAIIIGVACFSIYVMFLYEYEIPTQKEYSTKVRLFIKPVSGETRIVDAETGRNILVSYYDSFGVTLENVEKLPDGEWKVTVKDHGQH